MNNRIAINMIKSYSCLTDTSPSYLLFQTLLPLFWTLTCMNWMELTRTDTVFSRITIVLFMCRSKRSRNDLKTSRRHFSENKKNTCQRWRPGGHHLATRVGGAPPTSWAPYCVSDSNSIYSRSGRKNQSERFIAFYDMEPPPSPKLSQEG